MLKKECQGCDYSRLQPHEICGDCPADVQTKCGGCDRHTQLFGEERLGYCMKYHVKTDYDRHDGGYFRCAACTAKGDDADESAPSA